MIAITKAEAKIVRENFPWVHMRRTVNKYYMEENQRIIKALKEIERSEGAGKRA